MMRSNLRVLCFAATIVVWPLASAGGTEPASTTTDIQLEIPLGPAKVFVDLVLPKSKNPKALVLVVPGTGGLSDPYFDYEIQRENYDSHSRGGLSKSLVSKGYAVAFYNQRGYYPLSTCVTGGGFRERVESFVNNCIEGEIRKDVDLHTITSDTDAVISNLRHSKYTRTLPQIVLAYSEGLYHISSLVSSGRYSPLGIVGIGGPWESLSDTLAYQFTKEYYIRLVERALGACPNKINLNLQRLFKCAGTPYSSSVGRNIDAIFQGRTLDQENLRLVKRELLTYQQQGFAAFANVPADSTLNGMFHGAYIPVAWSAKFYQQMFASKVRIADQLANFKRPTILLYGGKDDLVRLPENRTCGGGRFISASNCKSEIIEGAEHGLQDESGKLGPRSMKAIVDAVNYIYEKK